MSWKKHRNNLNGTAKAVPLIILSIITVDFRLSRLTNPILTMYTKHMLTQNKMPNYDLRRKL